MIDVTKPVRIDGPPHTVKHVTALLDGSNTATVYCPTCNVDRRLYIPVGADRGSTVLSLWKPMDNDCRHSAHK
jgi:hypothetical protein